MRNRIAQQKAQDNVQKAVERVSGQFNGVSLFTSSRSIDIEIADRSKLPVETSDTPLQTEDGDFIFMIGYSQVGGGDVIG
jgi:hypothetical protein